MAKPKEVKKLVPKNKPLPKKKASGTGGAGDAALTKLASNSRGLSKFLIGKVGEVEKLEQQRRALGKVINGVYAEIKQNGFPVKAVRAVVALRRMDNEERVHHEENIAIVKEALGEQLTLWDRAAMGETREPIEDGEPGPNPEEVAIKRSSASSLEAAPVH